MAVTEICVNVKHIRTEIEIYRFYHFHSIYIIYIQEGMESCAFPNKINSIRTESSSVKV